VRQGSRSSIRSVDGTPSPGRAVEIRVSQVPRGARNDQTTAPGRFLDSEQQNHRHAEHDAEQPHREPMRHRSAVRRTRRRYFCRSFSLSASGCNRA